MKYQYFYGNSTQYKSRCLVEILDVPADAPRVIMTDDCPSIATLILNSK